MITSISSRRDPYLGFLFRCYSDPKLAPIVRFARTLNRDIDAVRNAIEMEWSNGQAEGQINRLKTLKRAMYGRAGPNLLRARMLPLHHTN